jgi:hypothetical protein
VKAALRAVIAMRYLMFMAALLLLVRDGNEVDSGHVLLDNPTVLPAHDNMLSPGGAKTH